MAREPRISALSVCWGIPKAEAFLKQKFSATEYGIYSRLLDKSGGRKTSSVGRLFDAVASLLGLNDKQTYEGEAAMRLEALATSFFEKHSLDFMEPYFNDGHFDYEVATDTLLKGIIKDLALGEATELIAAKFHCSLISAIKRVAKIQDCRKIAFSGGVFQNGLLVDLIHHHLKAEFELYFHVQLSPNDENVSFGQLVCFQIEQFRELSTTKNSDKYVFSDTR